MIIKHKSMCQELTFMRKLGQKVPMTKQTRYANFICILRDWI